MKSSLSTVRNASHLLPTGGELVRDLADEIELLRRELLWRDESIKAQIDVTTGRISRCVPGSIQQTVLKGELGRLEIVHDNNKRIHNEVR